MSIVVNLFPFIDIFVERPPGSGDVNRVGFFPHDVFKSGGIQVRNNAYFEV